MTTNAADFEEFESKSKSLLWKHNIPVQFHDAFIDLAFDWGGFEGGYNFIEDLVYRLQDPIRAFEEKMLRAAENSYLFHLQGT